MHILRLADHGSGFSKLRCTSVLRIMYGSSIRAGCKPRENELMKKFRSSFLPAYDKLTCREV